MNRTMTIAAVVGLLVGVLGGFLYWGLPARRLRADLGQALERPAALERELEESRRQTTGLEAELRTAQGQLKDLERDLAAEREVRGNLEATLSRGRK
jgi:predicted  nucleic acid-binding Zn-ribbon protein